MPPRNPTTYLVETYVPKLDEATAVALSVRLRAAIGELQREGLALRWLRSFALVGEETYMCMLTATDALDIALVHRRAGVTFDHVAEVVPGEATGG
jgi:Protein of unknown function (DUF4242)